MPGGNAYKPGDIITTLSGKTIEVLNTDAEGRVVLADAITLAKQKGATKLIDLATLTGAILVSLADVATGAVTNHQPFMDEFIKASDLADERVWQLPVYPEFKEMIKSSVADVKNTGGRYAGSITGGLFIGEFAEDTPWIHLDIAGTAFLDKARGVNPKGGTGIMVRSVLNLIDMQSART
jgi:leucyl aminopeptidase